MATLSGKDTLHDTVGIIYQNKNGEEIEKNENPNALLPSSSQRKRRRVFDVLDDEIEPYRKKPKLSEVLDFPIFSIKMDKYKYIQRFDNIWIMLLALVETEIPMWTGWNNQMSSNVLPIQNICYLPPINESPTSVSVVAHTLKLAQNIASECQQQYISVTYDLAIAKLAMQIQSEERPKYNNVFIQLGAFHIQMAFFKAVGKYIEESGGPYILAESGVLASGALKGFLTGTHYNRCKRIHPMFAAAFQILHFRAYLDANKICTDDVINELTLIQKENLAESSFSPFLVEILNVYEKYYQETEEGVHGATAKYWITNINFIKLFQEFSRSIRTNDLDLYIYCLFKIAVLMFSMNHQNYDRWILKYYANLVNVKNTHPGLEETLLNGGISIRRTAKSFLGHQLT